MGETAMTRREALARLAAVGAVSPWALESGGDMQSPRRPGDVKIVGPTAVGVKQVITPGDIRFKGFFRFDVAAGSLWWPGGTLGLRMVNGEPRLFTFGNQTDGQRQPLLEFRMMDTPSMEATTAPMLPLVRTWGPVGEGRILTGGNPDVFFFGDVQYDVERKGVWWSYGNGYVPIESHPTIGFTSLNDTDGKWKSYGPWRTEWNCQQTRGALVPIPQRFADAYTGGNKLAVSAAMNSGIAHSPFGAILSALRLPDPFTTPADVNGSSHITIGNQGMILHDWRHPQARDLNFRLCGWKVQYDCADGGIIVPTDPVFGGGGAGGSAGAGENDTMKTCEWIDLPDKHGLLYFGQLVTTPLLLDGTLYRAPGDPDGFVHMWYGDPNSKNAPGGSQHCCHGQDDPWWGATGPGAHYRVPMGWIYNPNDLVATAQGKADLWSRTPAHTFQLRPTICPQMHARHSAGAIGASAFDAERRRVYLLIGGGYDTITVPPNDRPVLMVFDVA